MRARLAATRETWKQAFVEEMRLLLDIEEMPQDKVMHAVTSNNNNGSDLSQVKLW